MRGEAQVLRVSLARVRAGGRLSPSPAIQGAGQSGSEHCPAPGGRGRPPPAPRVSPHPPPSLTSSTSLLLTSTASRSSSLCRSTGRTRTATPAGGGGSGSGWPAASTPPAAVRPRGAPGTATGRCCTAPPWRSGERPGPASPPPRAITSVGGGRREPLAGVPSLSHALHPGSGLNGALRQSGPDSSTRRVPWVWINVTAP